jgi:spermidine synthase
MPKVSGALDDPRLELILTTGWNMKTKKDFDVAIIDSTDPIGPAAPLFRRNLLQNIAACFQKTAS